MATTSIDRRKLYEQVWSVPGARLAALYRISDVALGKTCKLFDIPRPPRGYWARIAAGQRVRKPPLPHPHRANEIVYTVRWDMSDQIVQRLAEDRPPSPVQSSASELHPLAAIAEQQLLAGRSGRDQRIATVPPAPEISVSAAVIKRAVSVLSALFHRWEARGGSVLVSDAGIGGPSRTLLAIGPDQLGLRLEETIDESKPLTDAARLTHRLAIYVTGDDRRQLRRRWWDTSSQRVERLIGAFVETVANALTEKRQEREDAECIVRQQATVEAIRNASSRVATREFYWRQELIQDAQRWSEARQIRDYLAVLKSAVESGSYSPQNANEFENWHHWAGRFADSIDPIVNGVLQEGRPSAPKNTAASDLDLTSAVRETINRLSVADTNALWKQKQDEIRKACDGKFGPVWNEITRVLEGLGYDVSKREHASDWW